MKTIDEALKALEMQDFEKKKFTPYLDKAAKELQDIDNKIDWFERKIEELNKQKEAKLLSTMDLFDTAMVNKHQLKNGYVVRTSDKYELKIVDKKLFFSWMKKTLEPSEVMEFLSESIKITALKKLCNNYINKERIKGELIVDIDGIEIKDVTYRKLTTERRKVK